MLVVAVSVKVAHARNVVAEQFTLNDLGKGVVSRPVVARRRPVVVLHGGIGRRGTVAARVANNEFVVTVVVDIAALQRTAEQPAVFGLRQISGGEQTAFVSTVQVHLPCVGLT